MLRAERQGRPSRPGSDQAFRQRACRDHEHEASSTHDRRRSTLTESISVPSRWPRRGGPGHSTPQVDVGRGAPQPSQEGSGQVGAVEEVARPVVFDPVGSSHAGDRPLRSSAPTRWPSLRSLASWRVVQSGWGRNSPTGHPPPCKYGIVHRILSSKQLHPLTP